MDAKFEHGRVDGIVGCAEEVAALLDVEVDVFVFNEELRPLDVEVQEHVDFRVVACLELALVIELHDGGHVIVGIEGGVVKYVDASLQLQGVLEEVVLVVVVGVDGDGRERKDVLLRAFLEIDVLVEIEMPCPECGHVHMETIRFDGIKTLEAAWVQMKNKMNTNAIQTAAAKMNVNRGPATNIQNRKPRNIQEAAQMRLMKKKGGK